MVTLKFTKRYRNYNAGDVCGLPPHLADLLIGAGVAVRVANPVVEPASKPVKNVPKSVVVK